MPSKFVQPQGHPGANRTAPGQPENLGGEGRRFSSGREQNTLWLNRLAPPQQQQSNTRVPPVLSPSPQRGADKDVFALEARTGRDLWHSDLPVGTVKGGFSMSLSSRLCNPEFTRIGLLKAICKTFQVRARWSRLRLESNIPSHNILPQRPNFNPTPTSHTRHTVRQGITLRWATAVWTTHSYL